MDPSASGRLADAHCHLDFARDPAALARELASRDVAALSCTVAPTDYPRAASALAGARGVEAGLGLHPWWVANGSCADEDVALFCELAGEAHFVGELGLDFARGRDAARDAQVRALRRCLSAVASSGVARVVSLHAVRSATAVLDELERSGLPGRVPCVMHWFSGTSQELSRAVRMGCLFSVGERMLATRRGRAYASQVPEGRMLLETDLPSDTAGGDRDTTQLANQLETSLDQAARELDELRGEGISRQASSHCRDIFGLE